MFTENKITQRQKLALMIFGMTATLAQGARLQGGLLNTDVGAVNPPKYVTRYNYYNRTALPQVAEMFEDEGV